MNQSKSIIKTSMAAIVLCRAITFSASAPNLLLNGSFESPTISLGTRSITNPASWPGFPKPIIVNGQFGSGLPLAQDGQQYVALGVYNDDGHGTLSQTFTLLNPGVHLLTWFDNAGHETENTKGSAYSVKVIA